MTEATVGTWHVSKKLGSADSRRVLQLALLWNLQCVGFIPPSSLVLYQEGQMRLMERSWKEVVPRKCN